jgi:hypothetical protein
MKTILLALSVVAVVTTAAQAQNYPWCAYYNGHGGTNCGFSTFQQCQADVHGIGGFCQPNTQYWPRNRQRGTFQN